MQAATAASQFWQWLRDMLAAFVGGATALGIILKIIVERKKQKPEIDEAVSRRKLNDADADNKRADSMAKVFETLVLAHEHLDKESEERRATVQKLEGALEEICDLKELLIERDSLIFQQAEELKKFHESIKLE